MVVGNAFRESNQTRSPADLPWLLRQPAAEPGYGGAAHLGRKVVVARIPDVTDLRSAAEGVVNGFDRGAVLLLHRADRKSTRLNSRHIPLSRMPSSACKKCPYISLAATPDEHSSRDFPSPINRST